MGGSVRGGGHGPAGVGNHESPKQGPGGQPPGAQCGVWGIFSPPAIVQVEAQIVGSTSAETNRTPPSP